MPTAFLPLAFDEVTQSAEDPFASLNAMLSEYNAGHVGPAKHVPLWLFARDAAGRITDVLHRREGDAMPPKGESDIGLFALSRLTYLERLLAFAVEARSPRA